jgi:hypothetical protein
MRGGVVLAAALLGCAAPHYGSGHLRCAPGGKCPDGFYCAVDDRCWAQNSGPDLHGVVFDLAGAPPRDLTGAPPMDLVGAPPRDLVGAPSECATALLCDGFEAAALDPQWQAVGAGGVATLDNTRAHRGTHSVHVHTDAAAANADPNAGIEVARVFPINGTAWVRAWFYFPPTYPTNFDQVINFLDAGTGGSSYCTKNDVAVSNDYGASSGPSYLESARTIPLGTWTCLRMALAQPGPTGDIHIYVDTNEASDAALLGAQVTPAARLLIGADYFGNPAMGASDFWIDDVIVDNKPISCSD